MNVVSRFGRWLDANPSAHLFVIWATAITLVTLLALLSSCGSVPDISLTYPSRWHDDAKQVTCWIKTNGANGTALSCLPDWFLRDPTK